MAATAGAASLPTVAVDATLAGDEVASAGIGALTGAGFGFGGGRVRTLLDTDGGGMVGAAGLEGALAVDADSFGPSLIRFLTASTCGCSRPCN